MSYLEMLGLIVAGGGTVALMLGIFLVIYFKGEWKDVRRISFREFRGI
ncbi:MAG: hypothetical protein AB1630_04930 [bacterium]